MTGHGWTWCMKGRKRKTEIKLMLVWITESWYSLGLVVWITESWYNLGLVVWITESWYSLGLGQKQIV